MTRYSEPRIRRSSNSGFTVMEFFLVVVVGYFGILVTAMAFWTQRNLDFWLSYAKGQPVHVPFIFDYLLACLAPALLLANVVAEIARYAI